MTRLDSTNKSDPAHSVQDSSGQPHWMLDARPPFGAVACVQISPMSANFVRVATRHQEITRDSRLARGV